MTRREVLAVGKGGWGGGLNFFVRSIPLRELKWTYRRQRVNVIHINLFPALRYKQCL